MKKPPMPITYAALKYGNTVKDYGLKMCTRTGLRLLNILHRYDAVPPHHTKEGIEFMICNN